MTKNGQKMGFFSKIDKNGNKQKKFLFNFQMIAMELPVEAKFVDMKAYVIWMKNTLMAILAIVQMILKAEDVKFTLYVRIQGAVKIKPNVGWNQPTLNVTAPMDILVTFVKQVCKYYVILFYLYLGY